MIRRKGTYEQEYSRILNNNILFQKEHSHLFLFDVLAFFLSLFPIPKKKKYPPSSPRCPSHPLPRGSLRTHGGDGGMNLPRRGGGRRTENSIHPSRQKRIHTRQ
ncbi:hypothetical protein NPIL_523291 [Nephila pilipes]|uniref:Uncharacterized protein n=1 Tax=Nephila pilipes TaxID=299642 RepID=A0A8X6Q209_NEPPI|nr:hypothetical protein NPIL_523291 [Nephila pilipes]